MWALHKIYSAEETRNWVQTGCRAAAFGCLECKQPLLAKLLEEQAAIHERARPYEASPGLVREVIEDGSQRARAAARETMDIVRSAVGTVYR